MLSLREAEGRVCGDVVLFLQILSLNSFPNKSVFLFFLKSPTRPCILAPVTSTISFTTFKLIVSASPVGHLATAL